MSDNTWKKVRASAWSVRHVKDIDKANELMGILSEKLAGRTK